MRLTSRGVQERLVKHSVIERSGSERTNLNLPSHSCAGQTLIETTRSLTFSMFPGSSANFRSPARPGNIVYIVLLDTLRLKRLQSNSIEHEHGGPEWIVPVVEEVYNESITGYDSIHYLHCSDIVQKVAEF